MGNTGTPWWMPTNDPPTPGQLRGVRRIILVGWAIVLLFGVPKVASQAADILRLQPPGAARNQALRDLAAEAFAGLVAAPFVVLGIFGYGIVPRGKSATGPPYVPGWRAPKHPDPEERCDA
jgi:hypothetical protein